MYSYEWRKFLNNVQKAEVKETFHIFDKKKENKLYFEDVKPAFMALGFDLSPEDLDRIINNYKKLYSEKTYFTLEHFLDLVGMRLKSRKVTQEHKKIFETLVKKRPNRKIDEEYLREICEKFDIEHTQENLEILVQQSDLDKDGSVGEEDLITIFKRTNFF